MSKAFTKESDDEEPEEPEQPEVLPENVKNYMTPYGYGVLRDELRHLISEERPKIVAVVSWAASNGDRSENGDYIYGKRRLREIDRRVRYLTKQLEGGEIVDPKQQQVLTQVFFGASVTYRDKDAVEKTVKIVGIDEADITQNKISWISPIAKALMKAAAGKTIEFRTPSGVETVTVINVKYALED